jgi:hypothetical protein
MVRIFLRGGLGNQMFQYAAGLRLSVKTGAPLIIDYTYVNDRFPRPSFTPRKYSLDIFTTQPRFTIFTKLSTAFPIPGIWLGLDVLLIGIRALFRREKIFIEKNNFILDADVLNASGNATLIGYWQTEKYFEDTKNEVRNAFQFRIPLVGEAIGIAKEIAETQSISLHVRRGDYVSHKNDASFFGDTNVAYYENAIAYIAEHVESPKFFVFSDDIAWCKENIKTPTLAVFMDDATAGYKASGHLRLMSLCKHNIIANSSFSWWGAWLNANPNKIVIAPKKWHTQQDISATEDIIPKSWIAI